MLSCDTVYRDARPGPRQNEFDLLKHDVLKYGKSWQELDRSVTPERVAFNDAVQDRRDRVKSGHTDRVAPRFETAGQ